jgi:hypothetical protein
MANKPTDVVALYGNWVRGDDDLFTHFLILRNGECGPFGQRLRPVTSSKFKAPATKFEKLTRFLHRVVADVELAQPGGRSKAGEPKSGLVDAARAA